MFYHLGIFYLATFHFLLSLSDAATTIKVLNGPTVSRITYNSALIYIELDQPTSCSIEYWSDNKNMTKKIIVSQKKLINHKIDSLTPYTTYNYRINCANVNMPPIIGGSFTTDFFFETPEIEFVTPPKVTNTTADSATIGWQANVAAEGSILYGEKELSLSKDFAPIANQIIKITELQPGRRYNYQVELHYGGKELKSPVGKFSTEQGTVTREPFKLQPTVVTMTAREATIQFETLSPSRTTVYYGTEQPLKQKITTDAFVTEHTIELKELKPNANYLYRVEITTQKGSTSKSPDFPFTTNIID